jgi:hypothetical protein
MGLQPVSEFRSATGGAYFVDLLLAGEQMKPASSPLIDDVRWCAARRQQGTDYDIAV